MNRILYHKIVSCYRRPSYMGGVLVLQLFQRVKMRLYDASKPPMFAKLIAAGDT